MVVVVVVVVVVRMSHGEGIVILCRREMRREVELEVGTTTRMY